MFLAPNFTFGVINSLIVGFVLIAVVHITYFIALVDPAVITVGFVLIVLPVILLFLLLFLLCFAVVDSIVSNSIVVRFDVIVVPAGLLLLFLFLLF